MHDFRTPVQFHIDRPRALPHGMNEKGGPMSPPPAERAGPEVQHRPARRRGRDGPPQTYRRALPPVLALALAAVLAAGPGLAQTAAEITPPSFAPEPRPLTGALVFTGAPGLGAPEGAEALTIALSGVEIEGAFPQMAAANRATVDRLTAGRIRASEIFDAAQALEVAYAEAGFVLARVVLPQQELRDGGRLRLVVVDGFVERIDTDAVPDPVRGRLEGVVAPLAGQPGLRLGRIERALLIAGDTFGVALSSALARGETPGGTQLLLDAQFRPVTGFVGFDTGLGADLGRLSLDAGLELNGLLGLGETLYLRTSANPSGDDGDGIGGVFGTTPRMRALAGGAVIPLGRDGLTFTLEGVQSRTTPDAEDVPSTSRFDRLSLRVAYPWIRTRARTLSGRVVLDAQTDRQALLLPGGRVPIHRDVLRVLRAGGTLVESLPGGGVVELDAVLSVGIDGLGARSAAAATPELPLSRQGADAGFTKLSFSAQIVRPMGAQFVGALSLSGQTAFGKPLLKSEQIGLAGAGMVSGLDPGSVVGDSGVSLRGELRRPRETTMGAAPLRLTPYAAGAVGVAVLHRPTALEPASTRVASIGVGLELVSLSESPFASLSGRIELARGFRNDGLPNENRLSLGASLRF